MRSVQIHVSAKIRGCKSGKMAAFECGEQNFGIHDASTVGGPV
jgi:hypothetical protein